jgi:hypothetical protein
MQDRPTASELLAAVRDVLTTEIAPALTDPRLRFRALIAANLAGIVARELSGEEERLWAEWERLVALDPAAAPAERPATLAALREEIIARTRALCGRIQAGAADAGPWRAAVWAYARWSVEQKLQVANPRYLERVGAAERGS